LGELSGRARVLRTTPQTYAGRTFHLCVLEFVHLDGQGWDHLRSLLHPAVGQRLRRVLNPSRRPMPVPVNRPLAAALLVAVPLLAPRDRHNLDLQLALAYAHDQHEDYERADAEFQKLLAALDRGDFPASRREELLVAAARCAGHAGDLERAGALFRRVLQAYP